jgi:hypothetical protein
MEYISILFAVWHFATKVCNSVGVSPIPARKMHLFRLPSHFASLLLLFFLDTVESTTVSKKKQKNKATLNAQRRRAARRSGQGTEETATKVA